MILEPSTTSTYAFSFSLTSSTEKVSPSDVMRSSPLSPIATPSRSRRSDSNTSVLGGARGSDNQSPKRRSIHVFFKHHTRNTRHTTTLARLRNVAIHRRLGRTVGYVLSMMKHESVAIYCTLCLRPTLTVKAREYQAEKVVGSLHAGETLTRDTLNLP